MSESPNFQPNAPVAAILFDRIVQLEADNDKLRAELATAMSALSEIVLVSRDDGLASMVHFMRDTAAYVITELSRD